jgi:hypothetical protein
MENRHFTKCAPNRNRNSIATERKLGQEQKVTSVKGHSHIHQMVRTHWDNGGYDTPHLQRTRLRTTTLRTRMVLEALLQVSTDRPLFDPWLWKTAEL